MGKAGLSDKGTAEYYWKTAPILGYGVRMRTSKAFAIEGILDYAVHTYSPPTWQLPLFDDPLNRILEFNLIARLSILLYEPLYFDFFVGLGIAHQDVDGIIRAANGYADSIDGYQRTGTSRIFGVAFEARISERYELSIEGSFHLRYHLYPVAQLSLSYALED